MAKSSGESKPGVTGFVQEYNQEPAAQQTDLNPDAVTAETVLPTARVAPVKTTRAAKATRKTSSKRS